MNTIAKTYQAESVELDVGSRTIISVINSDAIDRDNEIVQPKGMNKKDFQNNPVVLLSHDYRSLPIGKNLWIKPSVEKGKDVLIAKSYISDKTQQSRDVFSLFQDKVLNAFSIGFNSIENGPPTAAEIKSKSHYADAINVHRKWDQLEYSAVAIPSNPDAIALAVSKGYGDDIIKLMQKSIPLPEKYILNTKCVDFAKSLIHSHHINDGTWQWDTAAQNELLGNPENYESYSKWFLAIDPTANKETKRAYHFPIGKNGPQGAQVYLHALANDEARAEQNGYKEIQAAAHSLYALASALKSYTDGTNKMLAYIQYIEKLNSDTYADRAMRKLLNQRIKG